jgi:hypothetical protein
MKTLYCDVLILCAPPATPSPACAHYLQLMQMRGALIQFSVCYADVGLTRCVQAAAAYQTLRDHPQVRWVFWLDWDMTAEVASLEALIMVAERLSLKYGDLSTAPTVSGAYVNRHDVRNGTTRLAAHSCKDCLTVDVVLPAIIREEANGPVPSYPAQVFAATRALCGMGCLLQSREVFMLHCDESEHFCYPTEDYLVPLICQSYRIHASELGQYVSIDANADRYYWQNEDFDYSVRELDKGRTVYVVDIPWGHEFMRTTYPDEKTVFPGYLPARIDTESSAP